MFDGALTHHVEVGIIYVGVASVTLIARVLFIVLLSTRIDLDARCFGGLAVASEGLQRLRYFRCLLGSDGLAFDSVSMFLYFLSCRPFEGFLYKMVVVIAPSVVRT